MIPKVSISEAIPKTLEEMRATSARWIGKPVSRIEDPALVTGRIEFIDDVEPVGSLHCAILRSPYAHARIRRVHAEDARACRGVVAVVTGQDALRWTQPLPGVPEGRGSHVLAIAKAHYAGEPVAAVAATSRALAEDALERIEVDYEPLPSVVDPHRARLPDSPLVSEDHSTNVMLHRVFEWGDVAEAFRSADHVFEGSFRCHRLGANPIETFGVIARWNAAEGSFTIRGSFQSPAFSCLGIAAALAIPPAKLQLIAHPHGGSFGGKGGTRGAVIAALLSRAADGRPVKWVEDRMEYLLAGGGQAWDRHYETSLAVRADGIVTGFSVRLVDDIGASGENAGAISTVRPIVAFTGCYAIPAARYDLELVATNKLPQSAYRGMGLTPHNFVLEQMMDIAARGIGIDPAELRRRNLIPPDAFPYTIVSGNRYDSGRYEAVLDRALEISAYTEMRRQQEEGRRRGQLVGIGVVNTIEPGVFSWNVYGAVLGGLPGTGVPEGVRLAIDPTGHITARVGFALEGQGQYTIIAQIVAEFFGVGIDAVSVRMEDTLSAPPHFGPGGSRMAVVLSGAVLGAADQLRRKLACVAAKLMDVDPVDIVLEGGCLRSAASTQSMTIGEVASLLLMRSDLLPPGVEPGAEATYTWVAPGQEIPDDQARARSYLTASNSCHVAMVEIDAETGRIGILRYVAIDDCGVRLNPAIVEGQIDGGLAQGVGAAFLEEYTYDEDGQPLTTTLADYLLPTIRDIPASEHDSLCTPSPFTPLGAKGMGEAAMLTTQAALMCAVNDALAPLGVRATETPAAPERIWRLLSGRRTHA